MVKFPLVSVKINIIGEIDTLAPLIGFKDCPFTTTPFIE
jgi:hypothetical protein